MKSTKQNKISIKLLLPGKTLMIAYLLLIGTGNAQIYPNWFLNQGNLSCKGAVVGYANNYFHQDSSLAEAKRNGCWNYAVNQELQIDFKQAFWLTEGGNYWMGAKKNLNFDTSMVKLSESFLKVMDSFFTPNLVVILLTKKGCTSLKTHYSNISQIPPPPWTTTTPSSSRNYFATGSSPHYYYEKDSWLKAEENAHFNLARQVFIKIQSLQKKSTRESQQITNEEVSVTLRNVQVMARWKNVKNNVYYVLIKMPK